MPIWFWYRVQDIHLKPLYSCCMKCYFSYQQVDSRGVSTILIQGSRSDLQKQLFRVSPTNICIRMWFTLSHWRMVQGIHLPPILSQGKSKTINENKYHTEVLNWFSGQLRQFYREQVQASPVWAHSCQASSRTAMKTLLLRRERLGGEINRLPWFSLVMPPVKTHSTMQN